MHICFLNMQIEYYSPVSGGAIATIIMQHTRQMLELGHQVTVLTPVNGDRTYQAGSVVPLKIGTRKSLNFLQRRISDVRRKLHGFDYPYYEYYQQSFARELKRLKPAPDVVVIHNDLISPYYLKRILPRTKIVLALQNEQRTSFRRLNASLEAVDLVTPVGKHIREWTGKAYPVLRERFLDVGNGVDPTVFFPRERFLEPVTPLRVLFIGRLDPNKGPDIVADAVALLKKDGVAITLTVAGGLWFYGHGNEMANPYFRSLKAKMDAAQAEYLGHVVRDEVPELVRKHDVVCILSRSHDPYPLVTLEAMASGCAVLASDRGGLPEASGGAAILVNPDDFDSVAARLRELAADPALLEMRKQASIARAATQSWGRKSALFEQAFFRLTTLS